MWVLLNQLLNFTLLSYTYLYYCLLPSFQMLKSFTQFGDAIYRMNYVSLFSQNNLSLVTSRPLIALYKTQADQVWWRISHKATGKTFLKPYIQPWGALVIKVDWKEFREKATEDEMRIKNQRINAQGDSEAYIPCCKV